MRIIIDKLAFESPVDRGFKCKAHYLTEPRGEALVEIFRDDQPYRRFLFPAYKIWNIAAHFTDIVSSEIDGNLIGYDIAGWTGFQVIHPTPLEPVGEGPAPSPDERAESAAIKERGGE